VTLQPLRRFALDAAILFSDILTLPHAMGLGLEFEDGQGPTFARPVRTRADIDRLAVPDPEADLRYVMDAVRLIRRELAGRVPLIGFAGSPWTVATYAVEGGSSDSFARIKGLQDAAPADLHRLLDVLARATTAYLNAQIAAGAQTLMLFDTWGGVLTRTDYLEFSLAYMAQIVAGLSREHDSRHVPVILFTKGGGAWLKDMTQTGADALGIDWSTALGVARAAVGDAVALQGNLDPSVLYSEPQTIRAKVAETLTSYGHGSGHVFNLGHGIRADTDPEHARVMIEAVHELSPAYHADR
jgi:uroporphyrinogen decarboxylase